MAFRNHTWLGHTTDKHCNLPYVGTGESNGILLLLLPWTCDTQPHSFAISEVRVDVPFIECTKFEPLPKSGYSFLNVLH